MKSIEKASTLAQLLCPPLSIFFQKNKYKRKDEALVQTCFSTLIFSNFPEESNDQSIFYSPLQGHQTRGTRCLEERRCSSQALGQLQPGQLFPRQLQVVDLPTGQETIKNTITTRNNQKYNHDKKQSKIQS